MFQLISLLMEPQNREVGRKFLAFTVAMFSVPIVTFYLFHDLLLKESRTRAAWSGAAAVVSVNIIVVVYVVLAFHEDSGKETAEAVPAVGVWARKDRTD